MKNIMELIGTDWLKELPVVVVVVVAAAAVAVAVVDGDD